MAEKIERIPNVQTFGRMAVPSTGKDGLLDPLAITAYLPWNATCPECGLPSAALPRFHRLRRRHWLTLGRILTFVLGTAWLGVGLLFMISAIAFFFR